MSDDKDWRALDAKPMTFDQMTARAQYEWDRAEKAEAEALHCAQALTEARASAAHWRRAIEIIATIIGLPEPEANFASKVRDAFDELRSQLHDANGVAELAIKHRNAAESELSTLRARVREVVWPFGNLAQRYDDTVSDGWIPWIEFITNHEWPSELDCRAARQLMEEVK